MAQRMQYQQHQHYELQSILGSKLRSKRDLHEYMRQKHKKKYFQIQQIQQHKTIKRGWNEFSLKNIWPLIKDDMDLKEYMPFDEMQQGRFPNKEFFWGIAFNLKSEWANKYYSECEKIRESTHKFPIERKTIIVSESWRIKLMEHDFQSKGKKNKQSIVIEQAVRPFKKRDMKKRIEMELYSSQQQEWQLGQNQDLYNESRQYTQKIVDENPKNSFDESLKQDNYQKNDIPNQQNDLSPSLSERVINQSTIQFGVNNQYTNSNQNANPFQFVSVQDFAQIPKQYPQRAINIIKRRKTDAGNFGEGNLQQTKMNKLDSEMSQIDEIEQEYIKSVSTFQIEEEQK